MKKKLDGKYSDTLNCGRVWIGKRRDSGVWYVRCRVPDSPTPIFKSLGTTQKKDAVNEAELLKQQVMNRKYGIADGTIPVKLLFEKYFTAKSGRIKTKSFKRMMTTQVQFTAWLENTHPDVRLAKHLTPEIVRDFQSHRKASGLSDRTLNNDIKNMHTIFKWGMKEYLVGTSPFDYSVKTGTIDLYDLPESTIAVYTEQEYNALVAQAEQQGYALIRDLIVVFGGTGMRFEELAHLRQKNVHWNTPIPTLEVRAQNGWSPKDPKEVKRIPMLPEVQEVIRRRLEGCIGPEALLFTNSVGNKVHEGWTLAKLKTLFAAVGINGDRRLFWHSFRNYFVIRCLKSAVAVPAIMKWTGHDSGSMLLHYAAAIQQADVYSEFRKVS